MGNLVGRSLFGAEDRVLTFSGDGEGTDPCLRDSVVRTLISLILLSLISCGGSITGISISRNVLNAWLILISGLVTCSGWPIIDRWLPIVLSLFVLPVALLDCPGRLMTMRGLVCLYLSATVNLLCSLCLVHNNWYHLTKRRHALRTGNV
jgi:hypothetical protein